VKTNMRLGNDALVIKNISKLLEDQWSKKSSGFAMLTRFYQSLLNLEEKIVLLL
jgi:hypothetical protein